MNSFKSGLVSKDPRVAAWAARLISKIGLDLNKFNEIKKAAWTWFHKKDDNGCGL